MSSLGEHTIRFSYTQLKSNGVYLAAYYAYILGVVFIAFVLDKFGLMNANMAVLTRRANEVFVEKQEEKRRRLQSRGEGGEEEEGGGGGGGGEGGNGTPVSPRTHVHHNLFGQQLDRQYESVAGAGQPSEDFWSFLLSGKAYLESPWTSKRVTKKLFVVAVAARAFAVVATLTATISSSTC